MTNTSILGVLSITAAIAACTGQAGPDYPGEPLATIRGTVISSGAPASGPLEVALLWLPAQDDEGDPLVLQRVAVSGDFPASFTLDLFEPPPAGSYIWPANPALGIPSLSHAWIAAGPAGFSSLAVEDYPAGTTFGLSLTHQVLHLGSEIAPGSPLATEIGGPVTAGYHVTSWCDEDPEDGENDGANCFRPLPDDLDTEIVLELRSN